MTDGIVRMAVDEARPVPTLFGHPMHSTDTSGLWARYVVADFVEPDHMLVLSVGSEVFVRPVWPGESQGDIEPINMSVVRMEDLKAVPVGWIKVPTVDDVKRQGDG